MYPEESRNKKLTMLSSSPKLMKQSM